MLGQGPGLLLPKGALLGSDFAADAMAVIYVRRGASEAGSKLHEVSVSFD